MSHSLQTKLSLNLLTNDPQVIVNHLPDGWAKKFFVTIQGFKTILQVQLTGIDIKDGVLYINFLSMRGENHELANHVKRSVMQESAKTCMVCGEYARRRKEQAHKPALCRTHYLDYINALED